MLVLLKHIRPLVRTPDRDVPEQRAPLRSVERHDATRLEAAQELWRGPGSAGSSGYNDPGAYLGTKLGHFQHTSQREISVHNKEGNVFAQNTNSRSF